MHGELKACCPRFSNLVSSHEQTLSAICSGVMELSLLGIRSILNEPVLGLAARHFLLEQAE